MKAISRRAVLSMRWLDAARLRRAENYPSHPVKIVVPFPAGGSNDIIARILAQKLSERTGQSSASAAVARNGAPKAIFRV